MEIIVKRVSDIGVPKYEWVMDGKLKKCQLLSTLFFATAGYAT
jgi:hypothetical protein